MYGLADTQRGCDGVNKMEGQSENETAGMPKSLEFGRGSPRRFRGVNAYVKRSLLARKRVTLLWLSYKTVGVGRGGGYKSRLVS